MVQPPTSRTSGIPSSRKTTSAEQRVPRQPDDRHAAAVGEQGRLAGLDGQPVAPDPRLAEAATTPAVSSRAPTDEPAEITTRSLAVSAADRAGSSASGSSGTMPPMTGSPPASATRPASATADASRTWPGRSAAVPGGTTSSPVEKIATRGRACTLTLVTPAAASSPRSWARSGRPAGTSSAPAAASSSARTTPSPGATGLTTSIVPGIASCVYSTMTTASAPGGSTPPVGMAATVPGPTVTSGAAPIRTAPVTSR